MLVAVGRLGRPHGIRGEVTVELRTDEPERRFAPGSVLIAEPPTPIPLVVETVRWNGAIMLVGFENVYDRNAAELLRNRVVFVDVDRNDSPTGNDEYYDHQLVDLDAVVGGQRIGAIREVIHLPGQDLLAITTADGKEVLVPFVSSIVPEVDLAAGRVVIVPPSGLLTLNEDE